LLAISGYAPAMTEDQGQQASPAPDSGGSYPNEDRYRRFWTSEPVADYGDAIERELLHRDDGQAAVIEIDDAGRPLAEYWYRHGKRHREDGPAEVIHGETKDEIYWLHDEQVSREAWEREHFGL
jgi:hypothetical protein